MNLTVATNATQNSLSSFANNLLCICPSFWNQSIHRARLCPNYTHPLHYTWMVYRVNLDCKKEDSEKKECWQAIKNHFVPASFLSTALFTRSKGSQCKPRIFILSRPFIYKVHSLIKRPYSPHEGRLMVSKQLCLQDISLRKWDNILWAPTHGSVICYLLKCSWF